MPNIGVTFPATSGASFPITLKKIIDDTTPAKTLQMHASPVISGGGVLITIKFILEDGQIVTQLPSDPLPDEVSFFEFKSGNQIETHFDNAIHEAQLINSTVGSKMKFRLEFELAGKIGGAGMIPLSGDKKDSDSKNEETD